MLRKKHVLVLGAGASVAFGFPTGIKLCQDATTFFRKDHDGYVKLRDLCGADAGEILEFRNALYYSGKSSVDAFLEHQPEFIPVGKLATAYILNRFENPEELFGFGADNWLRILYGNLNTTFEEFGSNRLSIITFNYDRCVEYFLFTALRNTYKKSEEACLAQLQKIPIIHLHGRLGYLPWEQQRPENIRPFSNELSAASLKASADNIKIIHEDTTERDHDFKRAKQLLSEADRILFMGFGYNKTNMDRLDLSNLKENTAEGMSIGFGHQEESFIKQHTKNRIALNGLNCVQFIKERMLWE